MTLQLADKTTLEAPVEAHAVKRARECGAFLRKVTWIGRRAAPDRLLVLPGGRHIWIEFKAPGKLRYFPRTAVEKAQSREHKRMRAMGMDVRVIDSIAGVDKLFDEEVMW